MAGLLQQAGGAPEEEGLEGIPTEEQAMGQTSGEPFNEQIEPYIREQLDDKQNTELDRVLDAGMKILFGKDTHEQIFNSIRPGDDVPIEDELGAAATNMMLILFEKSGNSMPGEVVIPAGVILLARSVDYINEAGIEAVGDEQFGAAIEMFTDNIQNKFDPEFASGGADSGGGAEVVPPSAEGQQPLLQGGTQQV